MCPSVHGASRRIHLDRFGQTAVREASGGAMSAGPELALDPAGPEPSGWGDEHETPYRADDPEAPPDVVTRLLCAATHLHMSFADYVNAQLLKVSYSAICPSWGVDHVALA